MERFLQTALAQKSFDFGQKSQLTKVPKTEEFCLSDFTLFPIKLLSSVAPPEIP